MAKKRRRAEEPEAAEQEDETVKPVAHDSNDNVEQQADDNVEHEEEQAEQPPTVDPKKKATAANRADAATEASRKKGGNPKESLKLERKRQEAQELLDQQEIEEKGVDYERVKNLSYTVEDAEAWERKLKEKAKRQDNGFTDYAQVAAKKYNKQIATISPNMARYHAEKEDAKARASVLGVSQEEAFYRDANSMAYAGSSKPSQAAVDKLSKEVHDQIAKRAKFSKRRAFHEDDDVTYINDRNMKFNQKIARSYDKYTSDIKANFERGTAL
ncbi:hypothetical protein SmJEL517_g05861 [Synchytrium microbalum]|uniref:Pre-mRNA-splicing factor SYF2 n=1 Tax=Synchytrium microbalum TaxID=1806994 RepID=A0A507BTE5_9FUNG|nr:uncharacterized protein SmJEL517_g05861 [Synchytrium microbalum]TPX30618.1 hypothetical protein SmJEL517_g05861 [Synchytrium microbalum]